MAMNQWMLSYPRKIVTIYQIGQYKKHIRQLSVLTILQMVFSKTDICPLNSNIFGEVEFLSPFVTDRSNEVNSD